MRLHAGILTRNPLSNMRMDLLENTVASMIGAGMKPMLIDNGSDDGSFAAIAEAARDCQVIACCSFGCCRCDCRHTPGVGTNVLVHELLRRHAADDIVVLSDDDMLWQADAAKKLTELWSHAPDDLVIVSGLLEPDYAWSRPIETIDCGAVRVLVRESVPGAAWSFRARDWALFAPLREEFGQDVDACERLRAKGYRVGALDLAEHRGFGRSTWDNNLAAEQARELDRAKWGM